MKSQHDWKRKLYVVLSANLKVKNFTERIVDELNVDIALSIKIVGLIVIRNSKCSKLTIKTSFEDYERVPFIKFTATLVNLLAFQVFFSDLHVREHNIARRKQGSRELPVYCNFHF